MKTFLSVLLLIIGLQWAAYCQNSIIIKPKFYSNRQKNLDTNVWGKWGEWEKYDLPILLENGKDSRGLTTLKRITIRATGELVFDIYFSFEKYINKDGDEVSKYYAEDDIKTKCVVLFIRKKQNEAYMYIEYPSVELGYKFTTID